MFGGGVTATVDASGQLVVTDDTSGASQLSVSVVANNEGGGSLSFGSFTATTEGENALSREIVAGQDASFRVNGVTMTRSNRRRPSTGWPGKGCVSIWPMRSRLARRRGLRS